MNDLYVRHLVRLAAGLSRTRTSLADYITKYTYLGARRFSYLHHEYQPYIISRIEADPDLVLLLYKCSQLGVSEVFHRIILSMMAIEPGFSTLLGMPSQTFSQEVMKTRISQIIRGSKVLRELSDPRVDSASVKQFVNGSILYALGAGEQSGESSLINRPIKLICIDELDRCSLDIVTGFRSRQTHSVHKPRIYISTPTYEDLGIDGESEDAEVHRNIAKCSRCGHHFFPDYYEHVRLPGFDQPLELLTRSEVEANPSILIDEAHLLCPNCGKIPDLGPKYREFVVETPQKSTIERKICIKLAPFDAPSFIKIPDLIRSSFIYSDNNEFRNQALGLPVKASDSTIDRNLIRFENVDVPQDAITVVGLDMGKLCHLLRLSMTPSNHIIIHSPEVIPLQMIPEVMQELFHGPGNMHIASMVVDSQPYTDTVNKLVTEHPQVWSAIYTVPVQPKPELYWLKTEEEPEDADNPYKIANRVVDYKVRQITINKNPFFDYTAGLLQSEQVKFKSGPYDLQILNHILDMRRVRDHRYSDIRYKWVKSKKGADHFFHTINYGVAAFKLIDTANAAVILPRVLLHTVKIKNAQL
jgi:hypothetical protein